MQHTIQQRIAAFCMALVIGLSFFPVHAFAEAATPETALEPSEEQQAQNGAALSDNAAAFLAAVSAFDADAMIATSHAWGMASQAWQADPDNEELSAALEDAIAAQDAACAPLYEAEDLYLSLSEEEQQHPDVASAYGTLTALYASITSAMEHPVAPSDPERPESSAETILYDDLPDAPTGSYIGSRGLPVATGTTKVSLSEWNVNQLGGASEGYLDANALNSDNLTLTVGLAQGKSHAIVPMMVQVEYPANGSTTRVELPETVTLLNYDGTPANDSAVLYAEYQETSAAVQGFYVQAADSFTATLHYTAPDGFSLSRTLHVEVDTAATASSPFAANDHAAVYADRPTPDVTSGAITSVQKVNGTWLIWFNGQEAYCCDNGLDGRPSGCPPYSYTATSVVSADQYVPGDHYGNQVRIWGGLEQLSMGLLTVRDSDSESENFARNLSTYADSAVLEYAARIYNSEQRYIIEHYPDSDAARIYLDSARAAMAGASTYASARGYYTFIYTPAASGWQRVAVIGPEIGDDEPDPEPVEQEYYASWDAPAQTASGSVDFTYGVQVDKSQLKTQEKVDGATIEIEPVTKSSSIEGGAWSISPAGKQTVTTTGHTQDDQYHSNGGKSSVSWSLHYSVSKTSGTVGPYSTQEGADSAASSARESAIAELRNEAQSMVERSLAAARNQLSSLQFRYEEVSVPYGFEKNWGSLGSLQSITVPANTANTYPMNNNEWSLQVNLRKIDSETGNPIQANAVFEIYQWDTVSGKYQPSGGYNTYTLERQRDGTYAVLNHAAYAVTDAMKHTLYYTQRNQGKFIIVETKAPAGYYGDWTDINTPGTPDTPLGKRAYYIEITAANNLSVLWLDNADYNADIETSDHGGTKLITSGGVETTVTISKVSEAPAAEIQYKEASRTYCTDQSGTAANEDFYTVTPTDGEIKNDRVLGEISLSKVDLDAVRTVPSHGNATLEGAVYDLYAAEDITHPDGVTGVVDYSQITRDGSPIWHTTIRDNSGQWVTEYLPVLKKDHLVASAEIRDGWLTFANLYLGKYYIVERSTGVVIPVSDGAFSVSGTYPVVNERNKEPTGQFAALARNAAGQYTDWVYRNLFSNISKSKALDGTWTYDGYYLSFAEGYLADEHNYYITPTYENEGWYVEKTAFLDNRQGAGQQLDRTSYGAYYHLHADNALAESQDQVAKGNVEISKVVSGSGQSNGVDLENAGFTFFLVSELSKAGQFSTTRTGEYVLSSILSAYRNPNYDNEHPKWDFSGESQAIAKTYEVNAAEISAYNRTLTAAGEYRNGKGSGWISTGAPNEYRLSEIFSSDTGNIRVQGLPYGTYLVVETTTPQDVYQAEPFLVSIDPAKENNPWSRMATPKGSVMTGSDSYQKYTVLDEEIEVYLRITKLDEETSKPVRLPDTAFQIYWLDENGEYQTDDSGSRKLVTMTDTRNGHLTKDVTTFYTNENGILTLPEKLPLGHYRIVEVRGPNGYYNRWNADGSYSVDFTITTDRIYQATGDQNENGMDTLVIGEEYHNSETLGRLTIRKTGEVLTGWESAPGSILDPGMTGEAEGGNFRYEERPLAGAEYTITAAEDIYTQDRQKDAFGNRTLWYDAGDVVAVVSTGDGTHDSVSFAPGRTQATYDFLSVVHDGTVGEVSVTLPLGRYHIEDTKPPYGYVGTTDSYDVTFTWNSETNEVVMAKTITRHGAQEITEQYEVVDCKDADAALVEQQTLKFRNEREQARAAAIKTDRETGSRLAGAAFNLYTRDAIYSADGTLLFDAGALLATAQSDSEGLAEFEVDLPIQGELYGSSTAHDATTNSGKYLVREIRAPLGYYVNETELDCVFVADGQTFKLLTVTCDDQPTECFISKRDLTNDEELPGATLTIWDADGDLVEEWISTATPHRITGLHLGEPYTLTETRPADGYALADSIVFRLVQKSDEAGRPMEQADVYLLTTHNFLFWTWDDWTLLADATVVMKDDTIKVNISKKDITNGEELPGATLVLRDSEGQEVERWTSTNTPHHIEKLPAGDYTLTEVSAPLGYAMAEAVEFTVLPTGEIQTVTILDDVIKVQISKKDMASGQELPGATLVLRNSEGQEVERWISTATPHYIEKLPAGDYTLTEISAPLGYAIANTVDFTVLPTGVIQTVTMLDDVIKVQISKQDMANGQELPGATLVIHDSEGQEVERWISTAAPHYIEKLPAGDYTLTEISAPNGYHVAETIRFTIRPTGEIQTVTMKDKRIEPPPQEHPDTPDPPSPTPAPTPMPTPARTPTIPQTGDSFPVVLLVVLLLASAAALFSVALYGRRNRLPKPIDKPKSIAIQRNRTKV